MKKLQGKKSMRRYAAFMAVALLCALLGGTVGAALAEEPGAAAAPQSAVTPYSAVYSADNPIPQIAANVRPAVVQVINVAQTWNRQTGEKAVDQAYGSGVYIDERGYIVTNYHVVENADQVEVMTLSGERIPAQLVGTDDGTDLAVVKIEKKLDAQPVPLGDSDQLQIGELAIAIGNPGASESILFGTVTAGIISALDREDVNANNFTRRVSVIQTDAAINSGNSGGALLNARGELIGIPTLKIMYGLGTVYEGLGFAVPINTAKPIIDQLIASGKVARPRLGVTVANFDGPDEPLKNYPPAGVQILGVEVDGPAQKAGVQMYDIVTAIDGLRVKSYSELTQEVDNHDAGEKVKLSIYRCYNPTNGAPLDQAEELELEVALEVVE